MEHKKDDNIQKYGIGNPGAGFRDRHKNVAGLNHLMGYTDLNVNIEDSSI